MNFDLDPHSPEAYEALSFEARQAAKQAERERDERALLEGTITPEELHAKNYWFYGLRPDQITIDLSHTRELY